MHLEFSNQDTDNIKNTYSTESLHRSQAIQNNFDYYIGNDDNEDMLFNRQSFTEMVSNDNVDFTDYINTLLGNNGNGGDVCKITDNSVLESQVLKIADRQREIFLEDLNNGTLGVTDSAVAFAGGSYPMLVDLYTDPSINSIATQHIIDKSPFTFKRGWVSGDVENSDGSTSTFRLPDNKNLVRGKLHELTIPSGNTNLFIDSGSQRTVNGREINYKNTAINKSLFSVYSVTVTDDDDGAGGVAGTPNEHEVDIILRPIQQPNARNAIQYKFTFHAGPEIANPNYDAGNPRSKPTIQDPDGEEISAFVHFNIDWDTGNINWTISFENLTDPVSTHIYAAKELKTRVHFRPKEEKYNYVTTTFNQTAWDVDIDVKEMFRIPLHQEELQNYKDIDNIDLLKTFTFHLNHQFKLNKDLDIAHLLEAYIPEYERTGSISYADLSLYEKAAGTLEPKNMNDIFENIMISITKVNSNIHKIFHAWPQTLVAGRAVGAVLSSMNKPTYNVKNLYNNGNMGDGKIGLMSGYTTNLDYQKVIISDAIPTNHIYHIYKPPLNNKQHTVMSDIIYKPLYISEETHETVKSIYMKSRTAIEMTNPEGIGVTILEGYEKYFGNL